MTEPTNRQLRRWMQQWNYASRMLPELEYKELRNLSPERLLKRIDAVLSLAGSFRDPDRWRTSGLVQQQALFRKLGK